MNAEELEGLIQTFWTLFAAALVLFMQAGFCCLEAGAVRHKNSINVALKNIIDICGSIASYFIVGYAIMFGVSQASGWYGEPQLMLAGVETSDIVFFFFQATFCGTAATIVSGGIAERCRFLPYLLVSIILGLVIYPVYGHWVWGGGWLAELGFKDFAGSSVVHMLGAGVALAGIQVLGPRLGRFLEDGSARALPASSMPLVAVGVIILTFGWIGFNGGSAPLGANTGLIITNTILAACFGGLAALLTTWAYGGLARADLVLNGVLGGLVAVTACANCIDLHAAAVVGVVGGIVVVLGTTFIEACKIDDAVGAVPVHGIAGVAGILLTAAFADEAMLVGWSDERVAAGGAPLDRLGLFWVQLLGAGTCLTWAYVTGLLAWWLIGRITQLRIGRFEETVGMNYSEHKVANPVEELTVAVNLAAVGRHDEMRGRLDTASGDLASLAEAVRTLAEATERHTMTAKRFAQGLKNVSNTLQSKQRDGEAVMQSCLADATAVAETLNHVQLFLRNLDTSLASAAPMLADLLENLQKRLHELQERLPKNLSLWRELSTTSATLDRVLAGLAEPAR